MILFLKKYDIKLYGHSENQVSEVLRNVIGRYQTPATFGDSNNVVFDGKPPILKNKVSFIGLLGAGKSTASNTLVSLLNQHGGEGCSLISTDEIVVRRMKNPEDPIIKSFQNNFSMLIDQSVFGSESPNLEELFVIDAITGA